ncbi:MAG: type I pullulanase, partial [Clostridia bacterium]|nr:type I pullulanase [Clostridia bacterium]
VYDFETVDEDFLDDPTYQSKQNWGYDPKNYNVPEGSYSTDPYNGDVRINEFKQMVQALHNAGIGVIMDVVYNHTYTSNSWFEQTVPGYYYRQALTADDGSFGHKSWSTNALGLYNLSDGSGCGNETASERAMFRKYMIDSLVYWATEYHIDGFRFDLMGVHDVETMNQIRTALNELPGGKGILMYGEPWDGSFGGGLGLEDGIPANADHLNDLYLGIAAFNDRMREGTKGGNGWNNSGPQPGYVQGNTSMIDRVKAGINGLFLKYDGSGVISNDTGHTITYTTSHDNYTLWDQLIYTTVGSKSPTVYSEYNSVVEKKNIMAATLVLTSKGTSFMLAGEEIARTKYGNHNSYNAQDKINMFDYYRQDDFSKLYGWYKGLIELRTKLFTTMAVGTQQAVITDDGGRLSYVYTREVNTDAYSSVQVLLNPYGDAWQTSVSGSWTEIANSNVGFGMNQTAPGTVTVPAYGSVILVQK